MKGKTFSKLTAAVLSLCMLLIAASPALAATEWAVTVTSVNTDGGKVNSAAVTVNTAGTYTAYAAVYNQDGTLAGADTAKITQTGTAVFNEGITYDSSEQLLKCFVWDENLIPVAEVYKSGTETPSSTDTPSGDGFLATFDVDGGVAEILVSDTQDMTSAVSAASAYARNSITGEIDTTGDGQINFKVVLNEGYEIDSVTATEGTYRNMKLVSSAENIYRFTKITGNLTITVTTKAAAISTPDPDATPEPEGDGIIHLANNGSTAYGITGASVSGDGSTVTISSAGTYTMEGTLDEGQIVVACAAKTEIVTINLNGVSVTSSTGNPFNATLGKVTLAAAASTTNTFKTTADSAVGIFSENDLDIKGDSTGTVKAISTAGKGIQCKADLSIGAGNVDVTSYDNGIQGKKTVKVTARNDSVTVVTTGSGDGIKASKDPSLATETYETGGTVTINGGTINITTGTATVNGVISNGDGIQAATLITVAGGDITINAKGEAVKANASSIAYIDDGTEQATTQTNPDGNGCIVITGGTINATSGEDGIKATKDITISNGDITVKSALDGIQAGDSTEDDSAQIDGTLTITGGTFDITTAGGHTGNTNQNISYSCKGIKSNYIIDISGGAITVDSVDDAVHSNYRVNVSGGTLTLDSDDDGVHGDSYLYITDTADINVQSSYEGIEAAEIYVQGGETRVVASDDGVNGAGEKPSDSIVTASSDGEITLFAPGGDGPGGSNPGGNQGPGGGNQPPGGEAEDSSNYGYIEVSGGLLYIEAAGDGFDSNGNAVVSGGTVLVNGPIQGGNGILDVGDNSNTLKVTGGILIGAGTSDMKLKSTSGTMNYYIYPTLSSNQSAGKAIQLTDSNGNEIVTYIPSMQYGCVFISTPEMTSGTYNLYYGGTVTGGTVTGNKAGTCGLVTGGTYSGSTKTSVSSSNSVLYENMGGGM